jgi:hypothetical protein
MRKYLIAGAVAVMVFAFAAFAASLTVNGGTLQAGQTEDLTCTDETNVAFANNWNDPNSAAYQETTFLRLNNLGDCDEEDVIRVNVLDESDVMLSGETFSGSDIDTNGVLRVDGPWRIEDIGRVDVFIETQGF